MHLAAAPVVFAALAVGTSIREMKMAAATTDNIHHLPSSLAYQRAQAHNRFLNSLKRVRVRTPEDLVVLADMIVCTTEWEASHGTWTLADIDEVMFALRCAIEQVEEFREAFLRGEQHDYC